MYESPITQMLDEMKMHYEDGVYKAVQNVGFHIDKEELAKALQYDRGQYNKGFNEGYAKAITEFAEMLKNRCDILNECAGMNYVVRSDIDEIAEQLKGE